MSPLLLAVALLAASTAHASPVQLVQQEGSWSLTRSGQPFELRGVGGEQELPLLVDIGGTSFRTWGVGEGTLALLDEAHALGLAVSLGIWLGHERHGFDYGDAEQLKAQSEAVRAAVVAYRDHPALLMWGLGNEMEGFGDGSDPRIWTHVCELAAMVQELDPNHPVMTTTADIGGGRVAGVGSCEAIDIHGINSYGGALSISQRYRDAGGTKPIVLTEYAQPGTWEVGRTAFGAAPELTSTDKATSFLSVHRDVIDADPLVVGGYAFLWGYKTEATATWYGMFLPDGTRLAAVDTLAAHWQRPVPNRVPEVTALEVASPEVAPGSRVEVRWTVSDPEQDALSTTWELRREITEESVGGDFVAKPPSIPEALLESSTEHAVFRIPAGHGTWRIYAVVRDEHGGGATANIPLVADRPRSPEDPLPMPWYVYQDEGVGGPWLPTGWMGPEGSFELDLGWTDNCASPPSCIRIQPTAISWSGVAWQFPANNWGDVDGGMDLSSARKLVFRVRGDFDIGSAEFGVGLVSDDKPFPDSLRTKRVVKLSSEWKEVTIKLKGDRSSLNTGFYWVLPESRPRAVYLDDIRFE